MFEPTEEQAKSINGTRTAQRADPVYDGLYHFQKYLIEHARLGPTHRRCRPLMQVEQYQSPIRGFFVANAFGFIPLITINLLAFQFARPEEVMQTIAHEHAHWLMWDQGVEGWADHGADFDSALSDMSGSSWDHFVINHERDPVWGEICG
jgi:hypothetical protein